MLTVIFAIAVALVVAGGQLLKFIRFKKFLASYSAEKHVEILSTGRTAGSYILQILPVAVCIGLGICIYLKPDAVDDPQSYMTLLAMLGIIFLSSVFTGDIYQRVYYTDSSFFREDKNILFKSVRELNRAGIRSAKVVLKSGESFKVNRMYSQKLEGVFSQYNVRVKITPQEQQ